MKKKPSPYVVLDKYHTADQREGDRLVIKRLQEEGADLYHKNVRSITIFTCPQRMPQIRLPVNFVPRDTTWNSERHLMPTQTHLIPGWCLQR